ncbi:MAG: F0F1 ATP synthase subunit B [Puniceicoccales bacterium]|jgi:F-type H+-transporting ATPase subunit b|nr:F0F1 ATP synthase subunit B [Puniceicoccales bacterium]
MVDFDSLLGKFGVDWHLLLIQSLNFLLVTFLLYKFGFKSVIKVMAERREKIESGLEYADKMQKAITTFENSRAARIASVKKEAEDIVQSAKNNAKSFLEQGKMESRRLTDNMISNAKKEIALQHDKMIQDAKSEIGTLVVNIAQSVLSAHLTSEERNKYVQLAEEVLISENLW